MHFQMTPRSMTLNDLGLLL